MENSNPTDLVRAFYNESPQVEWRRLARDPYRRLEFETTLYFLEKYLPAGGLLLDAGGGPGRYTLALAERGYQMVLLDIAPGNLALARRRIRRAGLVRQVQEISEGSITDLSRFGDHTFDGVLCTGGPLSHVLDAGERQKAVAELLRVAKPGAPVFVSVMSRLSLLALELVIAQHEIELPLFAQVRDTGDYFGGHGFTACHFFTPEELRAAFCLPCVEVLAMAGLEGLSTHHRRELNRLAKHEKRFAIWLDTHYKTCTHPAVVGISEHMLLTCRKTEENGFSPGHPQA